jgi:alpha 1,2-mannosyltransferase
MKEQESGQLLIDKQKCWLPLNLGSYFNIENETYYKILYGDKDTFRFAWMALKQEFHFIQKPPEPCGYTDLQGRFLGITMVQYDESGHPLFLHRNLLKWDVTRTNELVWQQIKRFNSAKYAMEYIIGYSETNHHMTIDLGGDCELIDPGHHIVQLEEACLKDLEVLRQSNFYHHMLIHTHIKESRRFPDEYGLIHV